MKWLAWFGIGGVTAALAASCAYPDFQFDDDGDGPSSSTTATGGATSVSTGGVSANGGGGNGGEPPMGCTLGEPGACGPDRKCTVIDPVSGETGCITAGDRPAFAKCLNDGDCQEGLYCDLIKSSCRPVCKSAGECDAAAAQCAPAQGFNGPIPGLSLCTAHCHPETAVPCEQGFGAMTCYYDIALTEFDCAATLNVPDGGSCTASNACVIGWACVEGKCHEWCTPPAFQGCDFFTSCDALNPSVSYDGTPYGTCFVIE